MSLLQSGIQLGQAAADHYDDIAQIISICWPEETVTATELREEDAADETPTQKARWVATSRGSVVATGRYYQLAGRYHPSRFWLEVDVHPLHRKQGIGTALLDQLMREVEDRGCLTARVAISDTRSDSMAFLERRGFLEEWRAIEKEFDLTKLDIAEARSQAGRILSGCGVEVRSLDECIVDDGIMRSLHDSYESAREEASNNDPTVRNSFDRFAKEIRNETRAGDSFVALSQGTVVGYTTVRSHVHDGIVDLGWTGVGQPWRRRGIARALKLLSLAKLKEQSFEKVWTTSNSGNQAMLTLNDAMGFRSLFAWVYMSKPLAVSVPGLLVRMARREDYARVAELRNQTLSEPMTEQTLVERDAAWPAEGIRQRLVACVNGEVVAYHQLSHFPGMQKGAFYEALDVDPAWRGQGIGRRLMREGEAFARANGGKLLVMAARDDRMEGIQFLQKRGYVMHQHLVDSVCKLEEIEVPEARTDQVQIVTWSEIGDTAESRKRLHVLHNATDRDTPGAEIWGETHYNVFAGEFFGNTHESDAIWVAVADGRWIGMTAVARIADGNYGTHYTGVLPEYRGRGVGHDLKRRAVIYARAKGATVLRTQNDVRNTAMLRINQRFGFVPEFGWLYMKKELR